MQWGERQSVVTAPKPVKASMSGFTIIEVMFFLAISGALVVALLATVGGTIARQRFSDSVTSLQAFMQQQYNETTNVVNDRSAAQCPIGTDTGQVTAGASTCVVLGKAIDFTANGSHVDVHNVIGSEPTNPGDVTGRDLLVKYAPIIDASSDTGYDIAWGATVNGVNPDGATRILLLRSPESGLVLTFGGASGGSLASLLGNVGNLQQIYSVCLQSADLFNSTSAVLLAPTGGAAGVSTKFYLTNDEKAALC